MSQIEEEVRREISDFREMGLPDFIRRDGDVAMADRTVSTVIGARRSGKSFRVLQLARELLDEGRLESVRDICYVDFDNPHLAGMEVSDLTILLDTFLEMTPEANLKRSLLFVFDEIHRIEGWEDYVVDLSRNPNWKVVVTGSSSRMLRTDISTTLRGKSISSAMYPLSFREFLRFKDTETISVTSTTGRATVQRLFDEYLRWGGFPALPGENTRIRETLLREYFDTMILRDIIQRYNIRNPQLCIALYRYLLALIGKPFTINSALSYIRQTGFSGTKSQISEYVDWAHDSWFLYPVPIFTDSPREMTRNYRKMYCIDWALATQNSRTWDGSYSRVLENLVYLELIRRFSRVNYYLTRKDRKEVDFIACDNTGAPRLAVQVCQDLTDPDTASREVTPLMSAYRYFKLDHAIILTTSVHDLPKLPEGIEAKPIWRWLLEE